MYIFMIEKTSTHVYQLWFLRWLYEIIEANNKQVFAFVVAKIPKFLLQDIIIQKDFTKELSTQYNRITKLSLQRERCDSRNFIL